MTANSTTVASNATPMIQKRDRIELNAMRSSHLFLIPPLCGEGAKAAFARRHLNSTPMLRIGYADRPVGWG
jgi:hypothetical protein